MIENSSVIIPHCSLLTHCARPSENMLLFFTVWSEGPQILVQFIYHSDIGCTESLEPKVCLKKNWSMFSVTKATLEVQKSVHSFVSLSKSKTPKQHKINHSTYPTSTTPLTPSLTTSQHNITRQHHNTTQHHTQHSIIHYITSQHHNTTSQHNTTSHQNIITQHHHTPSQPSSSSSSISSFT